MKRRFVFEGSIYVDIESGVKDESDENELTEAIVTSHARQAVERYLHEFELDFKRAWASGSLSILLDQDKPPRIEVKN